MSEEIRLSMGENGVLGLAPEMVEIEREEAEILADFLNQNADVRQRLKTHATKWQSKFKGKKDE